MAKRFQVTPTIVMMSVDQNDAGVRFIRRWCIHHREDRDGLQMQATASEWSQETETHAQWLTRKARRMHSTQRTRMRETM
ncbi:hypothetical protein FKM82_012937 [Ascaphus truei]